MIGIRAYPFRTPTGEAVDATTLIPHMLEVFMAGDGGQAGQGRRHSTGLFPRGDALLATRERMMRELQQGLDDNERSFLLSLAAGTPEWLLLGIAHLENCRASAGSCTTWRSCRRPMRGSSPSRPICSLRGWLRYPKR